MHESIQLAVFQLAAPHLGQRAQCGSPTAPQSPHTTDLMTMFSGRRPRESNCQTSTPPTAKSRSAVTQAPEIRLITPKIAAGQMASH